MKKKKQNNKKEVINQNTHNITKKRKTKIKTKQTFKRKSKQTIFIFNQSQFKITTKPIQIYHNKLYNHISYTTAGGAAGGAAVHFAIPVNPVHA